MNKPQYDIDEAWVQRYREGTLSAEEQRWLEANPFEAEALEGLAEVPNWQQDVGSLQKQLQERTQKRAILWVTYGRYAAAVAVLIVASWFIYQATLPGTPAKQRSYETQSDAPGTAKEAPLALSIPEKVDGEKARSEVSNSVYSQPTKEIKRVPMPEQETLALLESAEAPILSETIADEETVDFVEEETARVEREPMLLQSRQTQARRARFVAPADTSDYQITGKVYSADDRAPIPGVNIQVKGSTVGTITDINGQFQVAVPDSSNELVVSSIGYRSEEVAINQQDSVTVQLEADLQALNEVVVIGYGTQQKKSIRSQPAEPMISQKEFRTYLQINLQYPEEARQQKIEGNVKVQFRVKANGGLTDFTIKKSLGYGCDEEAIRLIQAGPNWQPALQDGQFQDQEVTVKVRFKLRTK